MSADEYYKVGVGLFNAGRFEAAARAFERAVAANPYVRDAVFNLSQALLAQSGQLEGSNPQQYIAVNERLVAVAQDLVEMDPLYRNGLATLAGAYRALADATSGSTSDQWRNRLVQTLQRYEEMDVAVSNITLTRTGTSSITLSGDIENLDARAGANVQLEFSLLNASGSPIATETVSVPAPNQEQTTGFRAEFSVQGDIAGWRYRQL